MQNKLQSASPWSTKQETRCPFGSKALTVFSDAAEFQAVPISASRGTALNRKGSWHRSAALVRRVTVPPQKFLPAFLCCDVDVPLPPSRRFFRRQPCKREGLRSKNPGDLKRSTANWHRPDLVSFASSTPSGQPIAAGKAHHNGAHQPSTRRERADPARRPDETSIFDHGTDTRDTASGAVGPSQLLTPGANS